MSKKERANARGQECSLQIRFMCNGNPETTVLAHVGKHGTAKRNHDDEAVFACSACHDAIDYRNFYFLHSIPKIQEAMSELREAYIEHALELTQEIQRGRE